MGCHRSRREDRSRWWRLRPRVVPYFTQAERPECARIDIESRSRSWDTAREVEAWLRRHESQCRFENALQSLLEVGYLWRQVRASLGI